MRRISMKTPYTLDSYGEVTIKGYRWKNQEVTSKAIVLISHGMAETIERYDAFASYLANEGYVVYGHSHRGHGETAGSIKALGILGDNGWMKAKEDLRRALDLAEKENPGLETFIFGHSMGSFLLRDFILDYSSRLKGVIISGTGYMPKNLLKASKILSGLICKVSGAKKPSPLMDKLSFGNFNKSIEDRKTSFDWLSRDHEKVQEYIDDPYCGNIHSAGFFHDFSENLIRILYEPEYENKNKNLAIFILSGDKDPVGDYGKGVVKTERYYADEGFKTTLKLYEGGRHEMLNETNREEVYLDVLNWLNAHV